MSRRWKSAAARRICRLTGKSIVEEAVVEIARRLTDGLRQVPVDLNRIFPRVRVNACRQDSDLMVSGELRASPENCFEIVFSADQPRSRQRFTIAHEIAHAVFEHTGSHCPRRGKELERICDMIATELLTPKHLFREKVRSVIDLDEVRHLAKAFDVSFTSAAIRCSDVFGTLICQVEDDRVEWLRGRVSRPTRSLKEQLQAAIEEEMQHREHDNAFLLVNDDGSSMRMRMQSVSNGEGRKLFVVSPVAAPVNRDTCEPVD